MIECSRFFLIINEKIKFSNFLFKLKPVFAVSSWNCNHLLLTLIRAAGGVYDFRNFEEVYLCNGLSSELQNSCILQKTSREYILLSTLEQKTAF
jgi:hypothetical protein